MQSQLSRVSALNKTSLDAWLEAAQVVADGAEKLGRLQFETFTTALRAGVDRSRSALEGKIDVKDVSKLPSQVTGEAAAAAEKLLGYSTSVYDSAHATSAQLFELAAARSAELRKGWFAAIDEITDTVPGGKTGGTKAALDSSRTTLEVVVDGFTRTAKQSLELTDAMVKSSSESAANAIKAIAARG